MNGSGYLPPFPFQGWGAAGPEVEGGVLHFLGFSKLIFLCLLERRFSSPTCGKPRPGSDWK